jgi:hypothetical protein
MPSISVVDNISGLNKNLQQIRQQTKEAEAETYRIEGMIRVFKSLQDVGVADIPVPEMQPPQKTLEPLVEESVLDDAAAVQEAESQQE